MRKDGDGSPKPTTTSDGVVSRSARSSFRAFSNCIKVISSGASTVARTAVSAASSVANRDIDSLHDQVRKCFNSERNWFVLNEKIKTFGTFSALLIKVKSFC